MIDEKQNNIFDMTSNREILLEIINERNIVVNSKSWRYTLPLRMIAAFIRQHEPLLIITRNILCIFEKIAYSLYRFYKRKNYTGLSRRGYQKWIIHNEPSNNDLELQKQHFFLYRPKISIVIPLYKVSLYYLKKLINSVQNQTYNNWDLYLTDGSPEINNFFKEICFKDGRIHYCFLGNNDNISEITNEAIKFSVGEYIAFMNYNDVLAPFALYEVVKTINNHLDIEFIYSDDDLLINGKRRSPYFKPDFAPFTLKSINYIKHFFIMKRSLVEHLGCLNSEYNGVQDYDYILRASELTSKIHHIRKILYHRHYIKTSTIFANNILETGKKVLEAHMTRTGFKGTVKRDGSIFYPIYDIIGKPSVSIIIPNKDNLTTLKICIDSILLRSTYENYEIVIIENNSENKETFIYYHELEKYKNIRVIYYPEKGFNYSKLINYGVKNCVSDFILQLNNDTEIITPNWLELMLGLAQHPDVGAVGVKLLYPDRNIQHMGIYLHPSGCFYLIKNKLSGIKNYIALIGACVMSRKESYEKIGYMDERFKVSHGDVDFCLALHEAGLYNVFTPLVELIHHEGKTRGYDNTLEKLNLRFLEWVFLRMKWPKIVKAGDPFVNILNKW